MIALAKSAKKPEWHRVCWEEWLRTDVGRQWASQVKRFRMSGFHRDADRLVADPPLPKRSGKLRTPETLTRDFGWAVRHKIGFETEAQLGRTFHTDQGTVSRAIRNIMSLLPPADLADSRFRRYVDMLTTGQSVPRRETVPEPHLGA